MNLICQHACERVDCVWNVMAHAQKPELVFRRKGRVRLNRRGRQFSRLLAAELCASAVVMLDTPCSDVVWKVLANHSIRQLPFHFPSPCVTVCHHISTALYHPFRIRRPYYFCHHFIISISWSSQRPFIHRFGDEVYSSILYLPIVNAPPCSEIRFIFFNHFTAHCVLKHLQYVFFRHSTRQFRRK
jgi:hypothetical protein